MRYCRHWKKNVRTLTGIDWGMLTLYETGQLEVTEPHAAIIRNMTSATTRDIKWSDGSKGICMLDAATLSVASVVHGEPQVGVCQLTTDGSLEGVLLATSRSLHPVDDG